MKNNKKLLAGCLALNAVLSGHTSSENISLSKYDRMYNKMVKNIKEGKSNEKNYQTIERILKQKNKELKDLYLQNDYIIKPEFWSGRYFSQALLIMNIEVERQIK